MKLVAITVAVLALMASAALADGPTTTSQAAGQLQILSKKVETNGTVKVKVAAPGPGTLKGTEFALLGSSGEHPKARQIAGTVAKVATAGGYAIGFALGVAALAYFKTHKDNPQPVIIRIVFRPAGGGVVQARTLKFDLALPN